MRARILSLDTADRYSSKIAEWLRPHCERLQISGEVRRRCPSCELIELLCIPRFTRAGNDLFNFLDEYVEQSGARAWWAHPSGAAGLRGSKPRDEALSATIYLPKCVLKVWTAREETWFARLIDSTGPQKHACSLHDRVKQIYGMKCRWEPDGRISLVKGPVAATSEEDIYKLLESDWLEPMKRR